MKKNINIPNIRESGNKYYSNNGINFIQDGIKKNNLSFLQKSLPKPKWLKTTININNTCFNKIKKYVKKYNISTVCEEAKCPNIFECWSNNAVTIMLLGYICTRACRFCSVNTGNPNKLLDSTEPTKIAKVISLMRLNYVVLTSVNRDDLEDFGIQHFIDTIKKIKLYCKNIKIEVLSPDFRGVKKYISLLLQSGIDVFAHNIETIERLTNIVRDNRSNYWKTLEILKYAKTYNPNILTKTSIMLGLGETKQEIIKTMDDLRKSKVDILTLGQYLQPTIHHIPVKKYINPEEFDIFKNIGLQKGFINVLSGPLVRSSYYAEQTFKKVYLNL